MKLNNLTDDRAVSPVIGVILMVAVTVILAAVVATFALDFTDSTSANTPQVSFDSEYENSTGNSTVTLTVQAADNFDAETVSFAGDSIDGVGDVNVTAEGQDFTAAGDIGAGDTVRAGDSIIIGVDGSDYNVDVLYQGEDSGESSILTTLTGPAA